MSPPYRLLLNAVFFTALAATYVHGFPRWQVDQGEEALVEPFSLIRPSAITLHPTHSQQLDASPPVVWYSGDMVTVSWKDLLPRLHPYWIGVYLVSDDVTKTVPMRYKFVTSERSGSAVFKVLNAREDVVFYLFNGPLEKSVLVAKSNIVSVATQGKPTGVRLALTKDPSTLHVTWTSVASDIPQRVQFGTTASSLDREALTYMQSTYSRDDLCGGAASSVGYRDPGVFYTARIDTLDPLQRYYYRVGSEEGGWSDVNDFISPPHSSSSSSSSPSSSSSSSRQPRTSANVDLSGRDAIWDPRGWQSGDFNSLGNVASDQWLAACGEGDKRACNDIARSSAALNNLLLASSNPGPPLKAYMAAQAPKPVYVAKPMEERAGQGKGGLFSQALGLLGLGDEYASSGIKGHVSVPKMIPDQGLHRGPKYAAVWNDGTVAPSLSDQHSTPPFSSDDALDLFSDSVAPKPSDVLYH